MRPIDVQDFRLNYDPEKPQRRFQDAGVRIAQLPHVADRLPAPPQWPAGSAPVAMPIRPAPSETAELGHYDAIIVTWTSAEAAALAAMLTPQHPVSTWYEYRRGVAEYIPRVTGERAPFNSKEPDMARYKHSLGLYFPCTIGRARVLLMKSGLHLDYDGPAVPVYDLMKALAADIQPRVFVTTGTGGGIGADVKLGDVIIASLTKFDCQTQFKAAAFQEWNTSQYRTSPVPESALRAITPALTATNAGRIVQHGARETPKIWAGDGATIVTTDFFGFDDSTNHFKLQGTDHRACDMGDAMVGRALSESHGVQWFAIRNASDPQIPNPRSDLQAAEQEAGRIYAECGAFTTAASVIASWAIVDAVCNGH